MTPTGVRRVKRVIESTFGVRVVRARSIPRGWDRFFDIRRDLPRLAVRVVLDVGANDGHTAESLTSAFPLATVHAFEPGEGAFRHLSERASRCPHITPHRVAVADANGFGELLVGETSDLSRLVAPGSARHLAGAIPTSVTTLDAFCESEGIARVGYLKVDTEGGELRVLHGASGLLRRHAIDLVEVEAGMNPGNTWHVPFEELRSHLEDRGYFLFGMYEQASDRHTSGAPHLRRSNVLFASQATLDANVVHRK